MLKKNLRRLLVTACAIGAIAAAAPAYAGADDGPIGDPATTSMNAGGGGG